MLARLSRPEANIATILCTAWVANAMIQGWAWRDTIFINYVPQVVNVLAGQFALAQAEGKDPLDWPSAELHVIFHYALPAFYPTPECRRCIP